MLAFFCVFALGAVILRRTPWRLLWRRLLFALGVCAVVFAGQIAVQQASIGGYGYYPGRFNVDNLPPFAIPLTAGFSTVSVVQHPASDLATFASCGSASDCALFGTGYGHRLYAGGEVTITTDGGTTWRSWLLSSPLNNRDPFFLYPACRGDSCISPVVSTGPTPLSTARLGLRPGDQVSLRITPGLSINWILESCPASTWCAGINLGQLRFSPPPALVLSRDGGATWSVIPLPKMLVPTGDFLAQATMTCPGVGDCLLAATLESVERSPAERTAHHDGATFTAVTRDAGAHWSTATLPQDIVGINDLACSGSTDCLALATSGSSTDPSGFTPVLLQTIDGGMRWTDVPTDLPWHHGFISYLVCATPEQCLVQANLPTGVTAMLRTTDAGENWGSVALPSEPAGRVLALYEPSCPTQSFCVMSGRVGSSQKVEEGRGQPVVLVTHDGGVTWTQQPLPVPQQLP